MESARVSCSGSRTVLMALEKKNEPRSMSTATVPRSDESLMLIATAAIVGACVFVGAGDVVGVRVGKRVAVGDGVSQ